MSYKLMMPKNGTGDALIVMSDGMTVEAKVETVKQSNWNVISVETENGKKQVKRSVRSGSKAEVTLSLRNACKKFIDVHGYSQRQMAEHVGHNVTTADVSAVVSRKLPFNMLAVTVKAITDSLVLAPKNGGLTN